MIVLHGIMVFEANQDFDITANARLLVCIAHMSFFSSKSNVNEQITPLNYPDIFLVAIIQTMVFYFLCIVFDQELMARR